MGAYQIVFDAAESISINRRRKVSQTQSRDGRVKATSLGVQPWQFEVKLPDGPRWSEMRPLIEQMEAVDRTTTSTVQISHADLDWLSGYQGDLTNTSSVTVSYTSGNTLTITGGATLASGYRFRAGDFVQLGSGAVYSVSADVPYNSNTITVHRPVLEAAGNYTLKIGQAVTWTVLCVQFPNWTIFARDQVSWDGPFIFTEAL